MDFVTVACSSQPLSHQFVLASARRRIRRRACSPAREARLIPIVLMAAFLCIWPSVGRAATSDDAVRQAVQSVLSNDAYQRDLPFPSRDDDAAPQYEPPPLPRVQIPEGVGGLAEVLLWTILAAVAVLVVFWLVRELPGQLRRGSDERAAESSPIIDVETDVSAATTLDEADRLAEQGAYAEAMHLLLLHTLDVMRRRLGIDFRQSQTSREILVRREISSDARTPLSMIVSAVELTYFGGRNADAQDYRNCRRSFERFAAIGSSAA